MCTVQVYEVYIVRAKRSLPRHWTQRACVVCFMSFTASCAHRCRPSIVEAGTRHAWHRGGGKRNRQSVQQMGQARPEDGPVSMWRAAQSGRCAEEEQKRKRRRTAKKGGNRKGKKKKRKKGKKKEIVMVTISVSLFALRRKNPSLPNPEDGVLGRKPRESHGTHESGDQWSPFPPSTAQIFRIPCTMYVVYIRAYEGWDRQGCVGVGQRREGEMERKRRKG